jgi:hypothetical protein
MEIFAAFIFLVVLLVVGSVGGADIPFILTIKDETFAEWITFKTSE